MTVGQSERLVAGKQQKKDWFALACGLLASVDLFVAQWKILALALQSSSSRCAEARGALDASVALLGILLVGRSLAM